MASKRIFLSDRKIRLIIKALKYDREENGDTKEFEKAELEADLKLVLKEKL